MEENKTAVEETVMVEEAEKVDTQTTKKQDGEKAEVKTFTQDEVNELIKARLAKEKKGLPAKDELEAFKKWQDEQKTEAEKLQAKEQAYEAKIKELESNLKRSTLKGKLADEKTAEYVLFEVSKLESDEVSFEEALEKFLTDNPTYKAGQRGVPTPKPKANASVEDEDPFLAGFKKALK